MKKSPNTHPLNVLCFGAGAIGTYIGGSLALSGNKVVFIERPENVLSIKSLELTIGGETYLYDHPIVTASIEDGLRYGPFDVALFAFKSFDTESTLNALEDSKDLVPPILCLQNGVENEALITEKLGKEKVIHATITSSVGKLSVGKIILERFRGVGISGNHPLSRQLYDNFSAAGLNPVIISPPEAMKWSKMLTNLVSNASSAILDMTPKAVFANKELVDLEIEQIKEALRIMQHLHIPVVDLPGTPVKAFITMATKLPAWISRPVLEKVIGGGRGNKMPSFHIDLHQGRSRSEVIFLNGAVSRYGKQLNIATPVNDFLNAILSELVEQKIPIDTFQHNPQKFLKSFSESTA